MSNLRQALSRINNDKKMFSQEICENDVFGTIVCENDNLSFFNFVDMTFNKCVFEVLDAHVSTFINCVFTECTFTKINGIRIRFDNCTFEKTSILQSTMPSAIFENCLFDSLTINDTNLKYSNFINNNNDGLKMVECLLDGIDTIESKNESMTIIQPKQDFVNRQTELAEVDEDKVDRIVIDNAVNILEEAIKKVRSDLGVNRDYRLEKIKETIGSVLKAHDEYLYEGKGKSGVLRDLDMQGYDFSSRELTEMAFIDCNLNEVNFTGAVLFNCKFIRCTMKDTILYRAVLGNNEFTETDISNVLADETQKRLLNLLVKQHDSNDNSEVIVY